MRFRCSVTAPTDAMRVIYASFVRSLSYSIELLDCRDVPTNSGTGQASEEYKTHGDVIKGVSGEIPQR